MGQSGSAQLESLPNHVPVPVSVQAQPLPVKKVPPPRPSSPPKRPRSPSKNPKYAVEKNRVLPLGDLPQRKLRPVSQEISSIYPEFADMFPKQNSEGEEEEEGEEDGEEDMEISEHTPKPSEAALHNGGMAAGEDTTLDIIDNVMKLSDSQSNRSLSDSKLSLYSDDPSESNLHRTHSLDRAPVKPKGHTRRPSRTTSLMNEEHTIFEDPRESLAETRDHLYDNWKKDPYMNPIPNQVSLPVKANFDIDVSYNMTYAQLAEHRRQKYLEELGKKTGINVAKLHLELADNSNVVYNPFQRQYSRESTRSTSTTSSDAAGVSSKKKKRAPPPPGTKSGDDEPPVDYEMDSSIPPKSGPIPTVESAMLKQHQRRPSNVSTASMLSFKSKPAPQRPPVRVLPSSVREPSKVLVQVPVTQPSTASSKRSTSSLPSASPKTTSNLAAEVLSRPQIPSLPVLPQGPKNIRPVDSSDKPSLEQEAISKLDKLVSNHSTVSESESESDDSDDSYRTVPSSPEKFPEKKPRSVANGSSERRPDIQLKLVKGKTPPVNLVKAKDANDIFRAQLAKLYDDRNTRREDDLKNKEEDEKKKKIVDEEDDRNEDMSARSEKKHAESVAILRRLSRDMDKKWLRHRKSKSPEVSAHETDDDLSSKEGRSHGHHRVFTDDWTPEHDLDSDDDIEDRHMQSHQRSTSEGFKSSIIPTALKSEIKKSGKGKYNKKQSDSSTDEKQKYESIRKLKKTMHKSVKNAFGSLSRASGKMLRKQRSMDFESEESAPPPSNWQLSTSTHQVNGEARKLQRWSSEGNVLTSEDDDSEPDVDPRDAMPLSVYSEKPKPELNGYTPGQTNSLHRGLRPIERIEDASSRLYKKKKKKSGYIPNGKSIDNSVQMDSLMNDQIKEKERQIEAEKQRHMEMERDMIRLQALEREERYRRLQTAHFQQQLQILQQSVGAGASALTAPPLPAPGGLHSYSVPDFRQTHPGFSHMHGQGLAQSPMAPGLDMPYNGGNMANLTSVDLNYLSNLMRMNGVQPPASPQQWTYLLGSINRTTQASPTKSMFAGPDLPQQPCQLQTMYVTTTGPDLSNMFSGQSLDESQGAVGPKQSVMDILTSGKQSHSFSGLNNPHLDHVPMNTLLHDYERSAGRSEPTKGKVRQRTNPVYYSSEDDDLASGLSPARTSRNFVAGVVKDYKSIPNGQPAIHQSYVSANGDLQMPGYASYVEAPHLPRHRSPEGDSSSGADR